MSNMSEYTKKAKTYFDEHPNLTETEKIMWIYLDLGKRFKFDPSFFFGGRDRKKELYRNSFRTDEMEKCFDTNLIICKSASHIMEHILRELGIKARTVVDPKDTRNHPHVYNIVTPADGSEEYIIDLQEDIIYMHYHSFTKNFGISPDDPDNFIISREEQKRMHEKFGYISPTNPYVDDYIYLFKQYLPMMNNIHDQIDFVLKNIDPHEYPNVDYWERRWKHDKFLKALFTPEYLSHYGKKGLKGNKGNIKKIEDVLHLVEFFKRNENGEKEFINGFFSYPHGGVKVYLFSKENSQYDSYNLHEFALKVLNEGIEYNQPIEGLKGELDRIAAQKKKQEREQGKEMNIE